MSLCVIGRLVVSVLLVEPRSCRFFHVFILSIIIYYQSATPIHLYILTSASVGVKIVPIGTHTSNSTDLLFEYDNGNVRRCVLH